MSITGTGLASWIWLCLTNTAARKKLFVDYAGQTVDIRDHHTGKINSDFAVLGASNYTYAEATASQQLEDWIGAHVRAFAFFKGVSELVIPDNAEKRISKACRYEPDIHPTSHDMALFTRSWCFPPGFVSQEIRPRQEQGCYS